MADWKVTLSRPVMVNGTVKTLETEHIVEGTSRNLAIPVGIEELFKREAENGYTLVPKECVDFWNQWRMTGGQLYEFQTEIEGKWGVGFGITEIKDANEPELSPRPQRNGNHPAPTSELPDLNSMLEQHLKLLTDRQAVLSEELQRKQAEYDRNATDIMRIASMIAPRPTPPVPSIPAPFLEKFVGRMDSSPPKKRGRPPKVNHAE